MSYSRTLPSLGQAKWVPGQISFAATREPGRLPQLQPLIEAGLPYAPYIEHGSFARGVPDVAYFGRDPYRGLSDGPPATPETTTGAPTAPEMTTIDSAAERGEEILRERSGELVEGLQATARKVITPGILVTVGAGVGMITGATGGLIKKGFLGGLVGLVGGGLLGYLAYTAGASVLGIAQPAP